MKKYKANDIYKAKKIFLVFALILTLISILFMLLTKSVSIVALKNNDIINTNYIDYSLLTNGVVTPLISFILSVIQLVLIIFDLYLSKEKLDNGIIIFSLLIGVSSLSYLFLENALINAITIIISSLNFFIFVLLFFTIITQNKMPQ